MCDFAHHGPKRSVGKERKSLDPHFNTDTSSLKIIPVTVEGFQGSTVQVREQTCRLRRSTVTMDWAWPMNDKGGKVQIIHVLGCDLINL